MIKLERNSKIVQLNALKDSSLSGKESKSNLDKIVHTRKSKIKGIIK